MARILTRNWGRMSENDRTGMQEYCIHGHTAIKKIHCFGLVEDEILKWYNLTSDKSRYVTHPRHLILLLLLLQASPISPSPEISPHKIHSPSIFTSSKMIACLIAHFLSKSNLATQTAPHMHFAHAVRYIATTPANSSINSISGPCRNL